MEKESNAPTHYGSLETTKWKASDPGKGEALAASGEQGDQPAPCLLFLPWLAPQCLGINVYEIICIYIQISVYVHAYDFIYIYTPSFESFPAVEMASPSVPLGRQRGLLGHPCSSSWAASAREPSCLP